MGRQALMGGAALAVLIAGSGGAAAQEAPLPETAEVSEIVVTAQRREQALTDVPISITVLTDDSLEARGAKNLTEAQGVAPGIYFSGDTNYGTAPIAIRGTGGSGTVFGDEPVAVYVDDVYLGRSAGVATQDLLDIAAIEIVRGPQGTLQGRNATAGALIIRTADPEDQFGGSVRAVYADPEEYRLEGVITGPLAAGLNGRLAVGYSDEQGWADNLATGGRLGASETFQVRGVVTWAPTERFDLRLSADYSDSTTNPATFRNASTPAVPQPPAPFVPTPQIPLSPGELDRIEDGDFALDSPNTTDTKAGGVTAQATLGFDAFDLVSVTAYRESEVDGAQDSDGTGRRLGANTGDFQFDQFSQELRLQSTGEGPFTWVVGAYYFEESQAQTPFAIFNYLAGAPFPAGPNGRTGTRAEFFSQQDTTSYAAFADGRFEFAPRTGLTLGVRYTDEEKTFSIDRRVFLDATNTPLPPPTSLRVPEREASFDNTSYRVVLDHQFGNGALIYAKYSTGFKSGGFNAFGTEEAFQPEELKSMEIGGKGEFLDRRLFVSAAAYVNEYSDLQIRAGVPSGGIAVVNAADSEIEGFEVEGRFRATDALTLEGSVSVTDAEFSSFTQARDILDRPADATGNKLPRTPATQYYVGASYEFTPLAGFEATAQVSYRWRDEVFFYQTDQDLPTFRGDSLGELDARLQFGPPDGPWSLAVFGRNLTDERGVNNVTPLFSYPNASLNDPRTVGVQASLEF